MWLAKKKYTDFFVRGILKTSNLQQRKNVVRMFKWKPELYLSFEKERTQPSIDLLARIQTEKPKRILDIGCGPGNSTMVLYSRWPDAEIIGVDSSAAMIERAQTNSSSIQWICGDATTGLAELGQFDVVFSNAAIQWMPNHQNLLPTLFELVKTNGVFAVQVPCTNNMPTYIELKKLAVSPKWKRYFTQIFPTHTIHEAEDYYEILRKLQCEFSLWSTDYYHVMKNHNAIVEWYKSTALRPYIECFADENKKQAFLKDYETAIKNAYPMQKDNKVLFPFTRLFFTVRKNAR